MKIELELTTNRFTIEEVSLFKTTPLVIQFIEPLSLLLVMGVVEISVEVITEFKYAVKELEEANGLTLGISTNYNSNVVERFKDQPMDTPYFCYNYVMTFTANTLGRTNAFESLSLQLLESFKLDVEGLSKEALANMFELRVGHVKTYFDYEGLYIENSLNGINLQIPQSDFKSIGKDQLLALFGAVSGAPYIQ